MVPDYPASPVGVRTALEEVSLSTVVATGTSLLPGEGSSVTTVMTPTGITGEEEDQTGAQGMRERSPQGGEEVDPDLVLAVVTTWWRSCTAEHLGGREVIHLLCVTKDPGAQMRRTAGKEKEAKGRIGGSHLATSP